MRGFDTTGKISRPHKGRVALLLALLFLHVFGTLYIPTLTADIVNTGIIPGNVNQVWQAGKIMLAGLPDFDGIHTRHIPFHTPSRLWDGTYEAPRSENRSI